MDLEAAREGGFAGGFFALYVPSPSVPDPTEVPYALRLPDPIPHEEAARVAEELFACLRDLPVTLATSVEDFQDGRIAAIAHLEGARAIADSGGVVGVNFAVTFLREDGGQVPETPITEIVRHVDYLVDLIGVDHVAFGSDFDGAVVPEELGGAAGFPKLVAALREAGYDDDAVAKITH